ncbi:MAG: hypothetical protein LBG61_03185, partial [Burkholderiales bacterium]|nr:hypothetical protein [Burkholderiales bacterium]
MTIPDPKSFSDLNADTVTQAQAATATKLEPTANRRLRRNDILKLMIADKLISYETAQKFVKVRANAHGEPLDRIALQQWRSLKPPYPELTVEFLVEWLAGKL